MTLSQLPLLRNTSGLAGLRGDLSGDVVVTGNAKLRCVGSCD